MADKPERSVIWENSSTRVVRGIGDRVHVEEKRQDAMAKYYWAPVVDLTPTGHFQMAILVIPNPTRLGT